MMRSVAVALILCSSIGAQAAPVFAYLLNCSGELTKFDTASGRQVERVMLSAKTKLIPAHGDRASSVVDGCAAYGGLYQAATHKLYTVAPDGGSEGVENRQFRLLSFHLPEVRLVDSVEIPDSFGGGEAPVLTEGPDGGLLLSGMSQELRLTDGKLSKADETSRELPGVSAATSLMPATLDLSLYRLAPGWPHQGKTLPFTALESTADKVLISYRAPALSFAVVDRRARVLTPLQLPFKSAEGSVHLAPGGESAFAQEAHPLPGVGLVKTTMRIALMNTTTGVVSKALSPPGLSGMYSLAVLPNGRILFYRGSTTRFFTSGAAFPSIAVQVLTGGIRPIFFWPTNEAQEASVLCDCFLDCRAPVVLLESESESLRITVYP